MKSSSVLRLINLLAAILLPACNSAIPETTVPAKDIPATTVTEVTTSVATPTLESGAWKTYRNTQAGFSVEYPVDWMVSESAIVDGEFTAMFAGPESGQGIMVLVQNGEFAGTGSSDIPNTRCEQIEVGGLSGTRCFDTLNFATSTTVAANGRTFTIATLGKQVDEKIYNHFLSTFQVIQ